MCTRYAGLALVLFSALLVGQEQQGQQPPPQPTPSPQPTPTQPGRDPGPQPGTQPQQPRFPQDDRDPFNRDPFGRGRGISGKIVPSPATRLRVDLYLDTIRLDTAYTDLDGTFRFERQQPGRRYEIHIDIGPGVEYVEEVDFSFNYPVMIHIRPQGIRETELGRDKSKGGGTVISLASLKVPRNAAKEFEKGQQIGRDAARQIQKCYQDTKDIDKCRQGSQKKSDEALLRLRKATELYPEYAEAFNEIGLVHQRQNQVEEARKAFEQAIAADPKWVQSYLQLASIQLAANQPQELLETSSKVLQLNPTLSPGHFFQSVAQFYLGHLDDAEKSALEADKHDHAQVPQLHLLLARIYQQKGNNGEAEKQLRAFLKENPNASNADKIRAEIEQLKK